MELEECEIQIKRKDEGIIDIWRKGIPLTDAYTGKFKGALLYDRDITKQKIIEQELLKAEKLKSIGVLAGGIAHDFNNLLAPILGNISIAKMDFLPENEIYEILTDIGDAAIKAKNLVQQLLPFARDGSPVKETESIEELIRETTKFTLIGSNVQCKFVIPENIWPVDVDYTQVSQVINNIVLNANQAMPQGGTIKIGVENIPAGANSHIPIIKKNYIKIFIEDSGDGISEDHLPHIFDPYFTTKEMGSGLGLSKSYYIIKKHDGYIFVDSIEGKGSTFNIFLPATKDEIYKEKKQGEKTARD